MFEKRARSQSDLACHDTIAVRTKQNICIGEELFIVYELNQLHP